MRQSEKVSKIVTRFAPSPTGFLHVGGARTALFNHFFTAQNAGKSILRIEDTDRERSTKAFEEDILHGLKWLGIEFSETFRQSERLSIYEKYLENMIKTGTAYVSKEIPTEPGGKAEVIRFKNPNKKVKFQDLIRGDIEFDTTDLKDFVIAKSLSEPLYHLAAVVDDFDMNVTHVIRGEDHISNTPRQILIQEAIGAPRPIYAHIPLILAPDRSKLSKRKHGKSVSLDYYEKSGYLPDAMNNFLALLGWNPGGEEEIFSMEKLIEKFDISKVQKGGAIFNIAKLNWINKQYITKLSNKVFLQIFSNWMKPEYQELKILERISPMTQSRIEKFPDIKTMKLDGEFSYYFKQPEYDKTKLCWKGRADLEIVKKHLNWIKKQIENFKPVEFGAEKMKSVVLPYAEEHGRGEVLWPFRFSLSGAAKSPDPFTLSIILGRETSIERIQYALDKIA